MQEGKVEISEMKYVPRNRKAEIKQSSTDTYKVYKALVAVDDEIDPTTLDSLKSLDIINQRNTNKSFTQTCRQNSDQENKKT